MASDGVPPVPALLPADQRQLAPIIDQIVMTSMKEVVTLRSLLRAIGDASFAPVLLLPAIAVATPLSGIPLFSSLMGIVIFLVSIQMLMRRDHLWLPVWVLDREVTGNRISAAFTRVRPVAAWVDSYTSRRFRLLRRRPFIVVPHMLCVLSGAIMPFLEFVPFSSSIVGVGVAVLALGMLARDGLVILLGLIPYAIVGWLIISAF